MCGRYMLKATAKQLQERFGVEQLPFEFQSRYNIAPSQHNPVVVHDRDRHVELMSWGLVPSWSKDPKVKYSTINARVEGIETKPAYRKPLRSQRCLVPASGFYEWKVTGKAKSAAKTPYFIHLKETDIFALAGLYDIWSAPDGKELKTYTIITTDANEMMRPLHERMPVILTKEAEAIWLDPAINEPAKLLPLLKPYTADLMEAYTVSTRVNSPAHDGPELIEPWTGQS
ncbi:MAG: SOS response-associated peptidase [Acidobacteriota bacterium]